MKTKYDGKRISKWLVPLVLTLAILLTACAEPPISQLPSSMSVPSVTSDNSLSSSVVEDSSATSESTSNSVPTEDIDKDDAIKYLSERLVNYVNAPFSSHDDIQKFQSILEARVKIYLVGASATAPYCYRL